MQANDPAKEHCRRLHAADQAVVRHCVTERKRAAAPGIGTPLGSLGRVEFHAEYLQLLEHTVKHRGVEAGLVGRLLLRQKRLPHIGEQRNFGVKSCRNQRHTGGLKPLSQRGASVKQSLEKIAKLPDRCLVKARVRRIRTGTPASEHLQCSCQRDCPLTDVNDPAFYPDAPQWRGFASAGFAGGPPLVPLPPARPP